MVKGNACLWLRGRKRQLDLGVAEWKEFESEGRGGSASEVGRAAIVSIYSKEVS